MTGSNQLLVTKRLSYEDGHDEKLAVAEITHAESISKRSSYSAWPRIKPSGNIRPAKRDFTDEQEYWNFGIPRTTREIRASHNEKLHNTMMGKMRPVGRATSSTSKLFTTQQAFRVESSLPQKALELPIVGNSDSQIAYKQTHESRFPSALDTNPRFPPVVFPSQTALRSATDKSSSSTVGCNRRLEPSPFHSQTRPLASPGVRERLSFDVKQNKSYAKILESYSSSDSESESSKDNYESEESTSEDETKGIYVFRKSRVTNNHPSRQTTHSLPNHLAAATTYLQGNAHRIGLSLYQPFLASRLKTASTSLNESLPSTSVKSLQVVNVKPEDLLAKIRNTKKDQFYLAHAEHFLPLLPERNYVSKLLNISDRSISDHVKAGPMVAYKAIEQPIGITGKMKPYQLQGLSFLVYLHNNGMSGILADEMGLGKTLQTLSLIQHLREVDSSSGMQTCPVLIVSPLSVLQSWVSEARRFAPSLKTVRFHGPAATRANIKQTMDGRFRQKSRPPNFDVIFTTYEVFEEEKTFFKRAFEWKCVILDEGHRIKNPKSNISKALLGIRAHSKLILTGTPIQNDLHEVWALLHWIYPDVFDKNTEGLFKNSFDIGRGVIQSSFMDKVRHLLELIMLRRTKESPGISLSIPPKREVLLLVPLTSYQRRLYKACITDTDDTIFNDIFDNAEVKERLAILEAEETETSISEHDDTGNGASRLNSMKVSSKTLKPKGSKHRRLMNILIQLRQICIHPYQLPEEIPNPYLPGEHVIESSGKFIVLSKMIDELVLRRKRKVLIFSEFSGVLDFCEELLKWKGGNGSAFRYLRFDGSTPRARRNLNIRLFSETSLEYQVMLISIMAGGLGINLTAATEVIFLDEAWNPQITLQAEARAHRIGQDKTVTVYKICTQGTVEQQMLSRIQKKLYLSRKITENMQSMHANGYLQANSQKVDTTTQLNTSQLMSMIRLGAEVLTESSIDVEELKTWDWATMIEKCRSKTGKAETNSTVNGTESYQKVEERWLLKMEKVKCAVFEGKKHSKRQGKVPTEPEELDRTARRIGKETTVMIGEDRVYKANLLYQDDEPKLNSDGRLPISSNSKKGSTFTSQQNCHICGGNTDELRCCSGCPRAYHDQCVGLPSDASKFKLSSWRCPQHKCADCGKSAANAGGLLFRCRYCPIAFCEDCLDWDKCELLEETLPELEALGYGAFNQAFYIICGTCKDNWCVKPGISRQAESALADSPTRKRIVDNSAAHCSSATKRLRS